MNAELEAIKDAWSKETGSGREEELTRKLADEYVQAHPEKFEDYEGKELPECVTALEAFRDAGMESLQWEAEIWLLHHFEPQIIGGPMRAQVRIPNNG